MQYNSSRTAQTVGPLIPQTKLKVWTVPLENPCLKCYRRSILPSVQPTRLPSSNVRPCHCWNTSTSLPHIEIVVRCLFGSPGPSGNEFRAVEVLFASFRSSQQLAAWSDCLVYFVATPMRLYPGTTWEPSSLERGVALDKQPGVRPIRIGEVWQRIEAKLKLWRWRQIWMCKLFVVQTNCLQEQKQALKLPCMPWRMG